jgi:hypothetical protein
LKEIALELRQAVSGAKRILFNRFWDCMATLMVGDDAFNYHRIIIVGATTNVLKWVILTPKELPAIEDIETWLPAQRKNSLRQQIRKMLSGGHVLTS